jgi:hypothetical protein
MAQVPPRIPTPSTERRLFRSLPTLVALGVLPAIAFGLACSGLWEPDFWWHVRAGQWIWATGRPPDLDPFSYGSADQRWIDLPWLFQVVLALVYAWAGAPGAVVLSASLAALTVLVGLAARGRPSDLPTVALCWVPGIAVMSIRFTPRPEMATLLFIAAYLAVLTRVGERPRLAWVLPVVQLVWVNTHGLFVFGPVILGLWWIDRGARWVWRRVWSAGDHGADKTDRRWWVHVGGATAVACLACLVNPYGVEGAKFPLVLYPKVSEAGNPYKSYIEEFQTAAKGFSELAKRESLRGDYLGFPARLAIHFLLLLLPISFLHPSAWRLSRPASRTGPAPPLPPVAWPAALLGTLILAALHAGGAASLSSAGFLFNVKQAVPWVFLTAGLGGGAYLLRRRDPAGGVCLAGGAALALWVWWLDAYFASPTTGRPSPALVAIPLFGLGVYLGVQVVRSGGSLFAMLLAGTFGYLALSAVNSLGRFGLVAAVVLAWNLGGWVAEFAAVTPGGPWKAGPAVRWSVPAGLVLWLVAMLAGVAGVPGRLSPGAFSEPPLRFPHAAVRFAGQDGMPTNALAYSLLVANTFVYHNAPERKVYLDARLEVPRLETFQTYRHIEDLLHAGDPRWADAVAGVGNPALLLGHEVPLNNGEAAGLVHPHWRLVYFDAQAAVFLPRGSPDLGRRFPSLDLAVRPFTRRGGPSLPDAPGAAEKETIALANLGTALCRYPDATWSARIPALLAALERSEVALREGGDQATVWMLIGTTCWALRPEVGTPPSSPADGWNTYADVRWAQVSYGLRLAHVLNPKETRFTRELYRLFGGLGMVDAQRTVGLELLASGGGRSEEETTAVREQVARVDGPLNFGFVTLAKMPHLLLDLLRAGRAEDATRLADAVGAAVWSSWDWEVLDRLAGTWLRLGYPDKARRVWEGAAGAPSEAVRAARVGASFWVERDLGAAADAYERARQADPKLGEAYWALAWIDTERGRAPAAIEQIRGANAASVSEPTRAELARLEAFLQKYASPGPR